MKSAKFMVKEKEFYNIINEPKDRKVKNFLERRSASISSQNKHNDDKSADRKQRLQAKKQLVRRSQSVKKVPEKQVHENSTNRNSRIPNTGRSKEVSNNRVKKEIRPKSPQNDHLAQRENESQYNTLVKNKSNYDTVKSGAIQRKASRNQSRSRSVKKIVKTETEELVFKPLLSKKSMQIASKLGHPNERLLGYTNQTRLDEMEAEYQRLLELRKQATPKINKKSDYIDKRKGDGEEGRFEALYKYSEKYRDNKEQLRMKKIEEEIQKEMLVSNKRPPTPKKTYKPNFYTADVDVAERNNMWKSKHTEKVKKLKDHKDKADLRDCTFSPQINRPTSTRYIKDMKDSVYNSEFLKEGLYDHFTRMERAKKGKSYKEMGRSRSRSMNRKAQKEPVEIDQISDVDIEEEMGFIKKSKISQTAPLQYANDSYQSFNESGSEYNQTEKAKSLVNILENLKKVNQIM